METLEFVIYPNGRVKETVTGIVGASCEAVTAAVESALGEVVTHQKSSEYYAQPIQVNSTSRSSVPTQVFDSQW
ncbi:MAG: DUF2997 domain-containing protein [Cyanobacteria bacterium J06634_6]